MGLLRYIYVYLLCTQCIYVYTNSYTSRSSNVMHTRDADCFTQTPLGKLANKSFLCICVYGLKCTCTRTRSGVYAHVHNPTNKCVCVYTNVWTCMCVLLMCVLFVCVHVCVCVCVHKHILTSAQSTRANMFVFRHNKKHTSNSIHLSSRVGHLKKKLEHQS